MDLGAKLRQALLAMAAEAALVVETDGATRSVFAGDTLELTGAQAIQLRIPNIARFTASSANAQAAGLEAEVLGLREKLARLHDGDTLPQLEAPRRLDADRIRAGAAIFLLGWVRRRPANDSAA